jgi:prephenate dehydrogenase
MDDTPWPPTGRRFVALVIGCGLIGGSIARAIRRAWPRARVLAADRPRVHAEATRRRVAHAGLSVNAALAAVAREPVDLVVLALPVDAILSVLEPLAQACRASEPPPLVLDVGSVKRPVLAGAFDHGCPRFVGGHPMAGNEHGGFETSTATLLDDRTFALCPAPTTTRADLDRARAFVRGLGAKPLVVDPVEHDRAVALTSHLPHIAAWTLMDLGLRRAPGFSSRALPWALAAGSWRDATRVAAADPEVWSSIVAQNRDEIGALLDEWIETLQRVRDGLSTDDARPLERGATGIDAAAIARARRRIGAKLPRVRPKTRDS